MEISNTETVVTIIWALLICFLVVIGLWAIFWPRSFIQMSKRVSKPVGKMDTAWLDQPHALDRHLYRYHRVTGLLILGLSVATLYIELLVIDPNWAPTEYGTALESWLLESINTLILVVAIVGVCVGSMLLVRPSAFKTVERWGNRWINTSFKWLEQDVSGNVLDSWVARNTRAFGLIVLLFTSLIWLLVFGPGSY